VAQGRLIGHGHHGDLARAGAVGVGPHLEGDRLAGGGLKQGIHVLGRPEVHPVDGQQVLARRDAHTRLGQRRPQLGIPALAGEDAREAVTVVFD